MMTSWQKPRPPSSLREPSHRDASHLQRSPAALHNQLSHTPKWGGREELSMAFAIDYVKNTLSLHSNEVFYSTMAKAIAICHIPPD